MNNYQKFWTKEIEGLLKDLQAPESLSVIIATILGQYSNLLEIYPNTVINALRIALKLQKGHVNVGLTAPMQGGKSKTINFLCNYVLPEIGYLKERENVIFVTSMRDRDLYTQNIRNLSSNYYDVATGGYKSSRVQVIKMDKLLRLPNPYRIVENLNIKLVVRDEDQYGAGEESTFDHSFFKKIRVKLPEMPLVSVSATLYDLIDAMNNGYPVSVAQGVIPPNYFGIKDMLNAGIVEDINKGFQPYIESRDQHGRTIHELSHKMMEYIDHLMSFDDGLGVIRISNTEKAKMLKKIAHNKYRDKIECIAIGSNGCDFQIAEGIAEVSSLVNKQKKRVFLIVVNALSAGKDFGGLKEKIRFGIEPRNKQLANGAQGIPGRICGYHSNRDFMLLASVELLEKYVQYEENWKVMEEDVWTKDLYNKKIVSLSTHCTLNQEAKFRTILPLEEVFDLDCQQIRTSEGRALLSFLCDEQYGNLLSYFELQAYQSSSSKRLGGKNSVATMRLASNYNSVERMKSLWSSAILGADFGSVMHIKGNYDWGLLIYNYPENHPKNAINFSGVRIVKCGAKKTIMQEVSTNNNSMYE